MISRRTFTLDLASLLLTGPVLAEDAAAGKVFAPKVPQKLLEIPYTPIGEIPNHRQFMRDIVGELARYARLRNPQFIVLMRNAPELLIKEGREYEWETGRDPDAPAGKYAPVGTVMQTVLNAIDGMLIDGLFVGRDKVDQPTGEADAKLSWLAAMLLEKENRRILTVEYCKDKKQFDAAMKKATAAKTLSYFDKDGDKSLGTIPSTLPTKENARHIIRLGEASNFLPMLRSDGFRSREAWITALSGTNYDIVLIDPFWLGSQSLTFSEIKTLRFKRLGARRLIIASLPVGRAMTDRFYWNKDWKPGSPGWLVGPDPDMPWRNAARYWMPEWKAIIGKYMQGLVDLGVDGVLLDEVDAYLYFEGLMPL